MKTFKLMLEVIVVGVGPNKFEQSQGVFECEIPCQYPVGTSITVDEEEHYELEISKVYVNLYSETTYMDLDDLLISSDEIDTVSETLGSKWTKYSD